MRFRTTIQWTLAGALALGAGLFANGQAIEPILPLDLEPKTLPPNPPRVILPEGARMQTILYEAEQFAVDRLPFEMLRVMPEQITIGDVAPQRFAEVQQEMTSREINLRDDGRVHVEIVGPEGGEPLAADLLHAVNTEPHTIWRHRVDAWVPIERLTELAVTLPEGYFMERAHPECHDQAGGEGAETVNSVSYQNCGSDGSGRTIAIMDSGYIGLTAARNAGDAPPLNQTTFINLAGGSFEAGTSHGTGCVEAAFDHAPGAHYRLYKTSGLTQFASAVDNAVANGAHVISRSISQYNQGWNDNTGDAVAAANTAANAGLLFFTSAGNRAWQHWQGTMNPGSGGWHRFSGNDETISITLPNGAGGSFWLQWNTAGGTYNYDLYLYDAGINNVLASSTNSGNTYESFSYTNNTGSTQTVHLAVFRVSGGNTEMEIFWHGSSAAIQFQYFVSASSITSPSNSTHANVISNAAVDWSDHDSPNGTSGIIQFYSSRGPSNSGATRPDISGPTNTGTTCCGGSFGGTSSATPNNAGAATAFWSAHPQFSASAVRWLMYEQAQLWKDWGASGKDNIYGHGGSILTDCVPGTVWLARSYFNIFNFPTGPYYTSQAAFNAAPNNGRVLIFPGGNYPETFSSSGTKAVRFESVGNMATLGPP